MMHRSLRWRIIISYAALVTLSMVVLSVLLYFFVRNNYIESLTERLQVDARLLSEQIVPYLRTDEPNPDLNELVGQYAQMLEARITVVRPDGRVIGESTENITLIANHLNRPEVRHAMSGEESSAIRFSDTVDIDMLYVAAPVWDGGEVIGVARVAVSLAQVNQSLAFVRQTMIGISLLTTILSIILAIVLGNYTIRPLQELTHRVQHMSVREISNTGTTDAANEVDQLSQAFTHLTAELNNQIDELTSERGKLSAVLTHMTDGVLIVDGEGNVRLINPAAMQIFGVTEAEALDKTLIEAVRNHLFVELWRKSLATGRQQNTILEISPDRLFIQGIATPLTQSMPDHVLLVFQDLTRVRRLEMVRRDFVSNVSHELRTPLASLKALTETLMEGALEDPPAARRFLVRMEHEIDNLTQMVRELLELSRIESGRVPLDRRAVTPYELITAAIERMQVQSERAGLNISVDIPEDIPNVSADPERMEQVLVNLIHNAIKFTSPGGEIKAGAFTRPGKVVFYVQDSGVGIPAESLQRIFERFYKADRARSGGGTGLGLSISRHLVEAHEGRIWAESEPGKGSSFYFSLPIT
jgi:two-component system, OmpR family, phosphate regulon sensor histidine kinase PhoR